MRFVLICAALALAACAHPPQAADSCSANQVRADIDGVLAETGRAIREKDIDAYMALIPEESIIDETSGDRTDRAQLRANVLRDWTVIPETLALENTITSLTLSGCDEAVVMTDQRWERTMLRPDRSGTDVILTTQRHRETWRRTAAGWRAFEIEELGGEVFVNGERYAPN